MNFTDICLMTHNLARIVAFYETLFNIQSAGDATHAALELPGLLLTIYSISAAQTDMGFEFFGTGTDKFTLGFHCADADIEYNRINALGICRPTPPVVKLGDQNPFPLLIPMETGCWFVAGPNAYDAL